MPHLDFDGFKTLTFLQESDLSWFGFNNFQGSLSETKLYFGFITMKQSWTLWQLSQCYAINIEQVPLYIIQQLKVVFKMITLYTCKVNYQITYSFSLSVLLLLTDDIINVQNCKWNNKHSNLFFYKRPKLASKRMSERVFVVWRLTPALCICTLIIMVRSQSETRTVAFCCAVKLLVTRAAYGGSES